MNASCSANRVHHGDGTAAAENCPALVATVAPSLPLVTTST
jgi:hypothetical protein